MEMDYTKLGNTGLNVSRLCFGCMTYGDPKWRPWVLTEKEARPFFESAFELGINFFDSAETYSNGKSEEILGKAVKEFAEREDVVIATKVFMGTRNGKLNRFGLSRKYIMEAIDASLKRLGTDYIDLYQIHRFDSNTPIEETMEALHDVVRAGKVRYIGASSMFAWQFSKAQYVADINGWTRFVTMQPQYNLVYREEEREIIPLCIDQNVGVLPWSPMARGFLSGNREKGSEGNTLRSTTDGPAILMYQEDTDFEIVNRVAKVAKNLGVTSSQVALAWVLNNQAVCAPIVGASKSHHLEEAVGALQISLEPTELEYLEEPYRPHPIMDHGPVFEAAFRKR